jgi:hypothetical protein
VWARARRPLLSTLGTTRRGEGLPWAVWGRRRDIGERRGRGGSLRTTGSGGDFIAAKDIGRRNGWQQRKIGGLALWVLAEHVTANWLSLPPRHRRPCARPRSHLPGPTLLLLTNPPNPACLARLLALGTISLLLLARSLIYARS